MDRQQQLAGLLAKLNKTNITDQNFLVGWKGTANKFISDHYLGKQAEFLRIFTSYAKKHEMIAAARKFLKGL